MSEDDVLFGYRLRVFDYATRTSVSEACRVFGIHRSTYYVWKRRVERHGLEILRPRERRRPRMPQQLSPFVEERIVAFALGHPGYGPRRIASELGRERWGGIVVSHNGVWRCLKRHGLNTRSKRLSLVAGYAAPYQPPRERQPERHVEAERPGELVGVDCFFVGRLSGTKGCRLAADRDRCRLLLRLGRARQLPQGQPERAADLQARPPRRRGAFGRRLAARACAHG
jgi:transposase